MGILERSAAMTVAALAMFLWAGYATAQSGNENYPNQNIRIIVPFSAGGATDVAARLVASKLSEEFRTTVIVENKPGATGAIAAEYVAKAKPDGYTLMMGTGSVNSVFPAVKRNLPFDTVRDFVAISNFFTNPNILVVHPSVPAKSVAEFIALLRGNPNAYNFASGGVGTTIHLAAELFKIMADVQMVHVPYKGSAPAINDLVAGHVKIMFDNLASAWPHAREGRLRALGVTGLQRDELAPGVPAISETLPGYDVTSWAGLLAPAKTPPAIVDKLSTSVQRIIKSPDITSKLRNIGGTPVGDSPEAFAKFIKNDIAKWRLVVDKAGVKVD